MTSSSVAGIRLVPVLTDQALIPRTDQNAHQVVLGFPAPVFEDLLQVVPVLAQGPTRPLHDLGIVEVSIAGDHIVGPAVEALPVLPANADHLGDQQERHGNGDVVDEVALAPSGDLVDRLGGDLAKGRLQLPDHAGGEAPVDQAPKLGMPRLVLVEEGESDRVPGTNAFPGVEELVVLGDVADVLELRDHPEAAPLRPVDRIVLAQPAHAVAHGLIPGFRIDKVDVHVDAHRVAPS
jgi:hypothetical protein